LLAALLAAKAVVLARRGRRAIDAGPFRRP